MYFYLRLLLLSSLKNCIKHLYVRCCWVESFCFSLLIVVMLVGWYSLYNNVERYPTTSISGGEGRNENLIFFIGHWTSLDFIGHPTLNIGLGEALLWASTRARSLGQHIYLRRVITIQVYLISILSEISKPFYSMTTGHWPGRNMARQILSRIKCFAERFMHIKYIKKSCLNFSDEATGFQCVVVPDLLSFCFPLNLVGNCVQPFCPNWFRKNFSDWI